MLAYINVASFTHSREYNIGWAGEDSDKHEKKGILESVINHAIFLSASNFES